MVKPLCYGRLGNFLYQVGCGISYALKHGLEFTIPDKTNNPKWNPIYLQHLVNRNWNPALEEVRVKEYQHNFQSLEFKEEWRNKNIVLDGYWQTFKYLDDYRGQILNLFALPYQMKEGYVSVHVRRGDYLVLTEKHPPVTKEWYEEAMAMFPGYKFKFFSDDIQWAIQNFAHREDCEFSNNTKELDDMVEASCCEHNICSSSTFSTWLYWLNQNLRKKGVFPKLWFTPNWDNCNVDDIVPPECIKL